MHGPDSQPRVIEPFFFRDSGPALYGCYHPPTSEVTLDCGLILCNPLGHEYIQLHRAVRRLATLLARAGFPVLRFDFTGCGDSGGDHSDWGLERWRDDVFVAVDQLRRKSGVRRTCAVGLRLGGALAMLAGSARREFDGMVLWDPVVHGRDYLDELGATHREMLRFAHVRPASGPASPEMLGFPLPESFRRELEQLNLLRVMPNPATRILVIESHERVRQAPLCRYLESLEAPEVEHQHYSSPQLWVWLEDYGRIHVPLEILNAVVSWVTKEYS